MADKQSAVGGILQGLAGGGASAANPYVAGAMIGTSLLSGIMQSKAEDRERKRQAVDRAHEAKARAISNKGQRMIQAQQSMAEGISGALSKQNTRVIF